MESNLDNRNGIHSRGKGSLDYRTLEHNQVLRIFGTDSTTGLSEEQAAANLSRYGPNEVPEKKINPAVRLLSKFWGLTAWMLELTMVFSLLLQRYLDFYIIGALIVLNAIIGFVQEQKASSAVDALKKRLQINGRVLRDGKWRTVLAKDLVPGDIVRIRAGDFVPADLKMIDPKELGIDQSALTGESMIIEKREDDILYSGSIVKRGESNGVVVATGSSTYFGKTTELLQSAKPKLHMEEITSKIVRWLIAIVGILIAVLLGVSYLDKINLLEAFSLALVLVVFAVPVALPAMFTISMAVGSLELAKNGVLVTRLSASEDAASMDVLCADKTGTITLNKLSVADVKAEGRFSENDVIMYCALASQEANQDPIDLAFISAARERNLLNQPCIQKEFVPFDSTTRRTEATVVCDGKEFKVVKGAVRVIAQECGLDLEKEGIEKEVDVFASRGYRTLGVATSAPDGVLKFCGLAALYDMPRPDSKSLIQELKELGVSVKMLTGDALPIAQEISKQVGLGTAIVRAQELRTIAEAGESEASEVSEKSDGFAEVYPEDKYSIVKTLQLKNHIVGMTGDGVNDAPALRQAEVGIAVSNATDVAKGAASVVLTREGMSNTVDLVKIGRTIYQRIVTWALNKIVKTFEVAVFVALAFLVTGYYVVSALDIVLLLFAIDFVTISLSTDRVRWSRKPDRWNVAALVKIGVLLGVVTVIELFGLLYVGLRYLGLSADTGSLHTYVFAALFYLGMFTVLIVRERKHFWNSTPSRTLMLSILADITAIALLVTIGIPSVKPIPFTYFVLVFSYSFVSSFAVNDQVKYYLMKRFGASL